MGDEREKEGMMWEEESGEGKMTERAGKGSGRKRKNCEDSRQWRGEG